MPDEANQPDPAPKPVHEITAALSQPFDVHEVKFKPQSVKGNRALAIGYVDARVVQDRLDAVLGVENWQDDYQILGDGGVVCSLSLKLGAEWVKKVDVGSQSEQPDGGDRLKAAFSDALKRAAVKFGIGRYLYRLPAQWCDYDPTKKQFTKTPILPPFAIPRGQTQPTTPPASQQQPAAPDPKPFESGQDMSERVHEWDAGLAKSKKIKAGEMVNWVMQAVAGGGFKKPDEDNPDALTFGFEAVRRFVKAVKAKQLPPKPKQVADQMAEQLQGTLDATGRRLKGTKWSEWLSEQGVPAVEALNKFDYAAIARLLSDLNTEAEQEQAERAAIQGEGA